MVATRSQLVSSLLSVDNIDDNLYRSEGPHIGGIIGPNRLFGGYIAAQVYDIIRDFKQKCGDTKRIFSMHYNFVSAGDPAKDIELKVKKTDDVYTVVVSHEHKDIGLAHVKVDEKFLESPKYPDNIPSFLEIPNVNELIEQIPNTRIKQRYSNLMDKLVFQIRPYHFLTVPSPGDFRVVYYARLHPESIENVKENSGMVAVVALSDFFVIQSAQNALNHSGLRMVAGASLHHKIHFHKDYVEAIQWFLVQSRTEIATGNKAKIFGNVFDSTHECVLSFIQEAYCVPGIPEKSKL